MSGMVSGLGRRLQALPRSAMVVLGLLGVGALAVAGILMYRTYDYVQHDNAFCMSCHLMQDPFARFEQSAHRGLGCKACHQPTFVARSRMALTQIIEQPASIEEHAEVPNERCAECHIEGDPEEWTIIASSAGHRVHFESDDPSLQGLHCVECHSSSIHVFTATNQTCGQAGCHEDVSVKLGAMGQMTIHCVACHNFSRPVEGSLDQDTLTNVLLPRRAECTACHQMRALLADFPEDEPHDAACGACHNPHTQETSAQAVQSCSSGGCHAAVERASPWHQGLDPGTLADCTSCHVAHTWAAPGVTGTPGVTCVACHDPASLDDPNRPRGTAPHAVPGGGGQAGTAAAAGSDASSGLTHPTRAAERFHPAVGGPGRMASFPGAVLAAPVLRGVAFLLQQVPRLGGAPFSHARHRGVACTACHATEEGHGALTVRTAADCQACHHAPRMRDQCLRCHTRTEIAGTYDLPMRMALSVWDAPRTRELPFTHGWHESLTCTTCHTTPGTFRPAVTCASCHTEHHDFVQGTECEACHVLPGAEPGPVHDRSVHLGCGGAGCHASAAVGPIPPARPVCLACHAEREDHFPGRECALCHVSDWSGHGMGGGRP